MFEDVRSVVEFIFHVRDGEGDSVGVCEMGVLIVGIGKEGSLMGRVL